MVKTKPFANLNRFIDYSQQEEEVLFIIGSISRLKSVAFDHKNQWMMKLN